MQGFTGLIFVLIALAWLAYLVPLALHRHTNGLLDEVEPGEPLNDAVVVVRRGAPLAPEPAVVPPTLSVSTPLTRRAALRALDAADARAARRRRTVVISLVLAALLGVVGVATHALPLAFPLTAVALLGAFLAVARRSVAVLRADLDAQAAAIAQAYEASEPTVVIEAIAAIVEPPADELVPAAQAASLLAPIPVTTPTYVSQPLASRTVRTIDLSVPQAPAFGGIPVTADAPQPIDVALGLVPQAVNA